jgi:transcriptional regulator with XRE-family HTH domain
MLLDLRERAELRQLDVVEQAGITQSMLSRAETGRGVPDISTTGKLADLYNATLRERERLVALVTVMKPARLDSRLIMQRGRNLRFQQRVTEIEGSCALVRAYQPHMIVGVLQTPGYALAVFSAPSPNRPPNSDPPADLVTARLARYRLLTEETHRSWTLVMSEACLHWHVGSPTLMAEQMDHLAEVSALPNVRLGIIPLRTLSPVFAPHGFDLYDSRGVCIGTKTATALSDNPKDIEEYEALFGELEKIAVFDDRARDLAWSGARNYRAMV